MAAPYMCKKCDKYLLHYADVVEYLNDTYCFDCSPVSVVSKPPISSAVGPTTLTTKVVTIHVQETRVTEIEVAEVQVSQEQKGKLSK